jgi:pyrimidine-nucleoside phosphorylase
MRAVDLIVKKRDGGVLSWEEIEFLIGGYVRGEVPDYQIASLAMAVFFRGMSFAETAFLTRAMIASGDSIDLSGVPGSLVGKHSTGGVGDKVSLILAPLAAACGCVVPMMSGRALGHTGGTLDKLESIPGYRTDLSVERFREVLVACGFAMIGPSQRIVPADRLLYALRDVTGTVESIPLITASIMSKKFAEGAQSLVFDVKCGSGAFMKSQADARALAVSLARTGASLGRRVRAVISDMDQPLGRMVGNFLEVRECVEVLQGRGPEDLARLTSRLTAHMLVLGGLAPDVSTAEALCRARLQDGSAWRRFLANVEAQGGRSEALLDPAKGPRAPRTLALRAQRGGYLARLEAYRFGLASGLLGASRSRKEDPVLPEVGIQLLKIAGDPVREGEELCLLHGRDPGPLEEARRLLEGAVTIADASPESRRLVLEEIDVDALGKD